MEYLKAALASALVALLLVVVLSFISSGGRVYLPHVDWEKVSSMNYEDAQEYLMERTVSVSRWESLRSDVTYRAFWLSAFADWVLYFLVGFASCVVYRRFFQVE